MNLRKVDIFSVRNIQSLSFTPSPLLNFIYGANASGKSALLESLYLLGRAQSFRTSSVKSVIQLQHEHMIVSASIQQTSGNNCQLGVKLDGKNIDIHINQQPSQKRSDLAYTLPLQLIHPKSYELLDAGPQYRREFLDWGCFNDSQGFLPAWRNYKKALSQRNALLKLRSVAQVNVWDNELINYGTIVTSLRQQYLQNFKQSFLAITKRFLDLDDIDIVFLPGWDKNKSLQQALHEDLEKDVRYGFTHSGPHRADFQLLVNKLLARDFVSRGHLKLLVLSLKLAQVAILADQQRNLACVLIDDFAAELDCANRAKLINYLVDMSCQVFITATEMADFGDLKRLQEYKMFHMERGNIIQM